MNQAQKRRTCLVVGRNERRHQRNPDRLSDVADSKPVEHALAMDLYRTDADPEIVRDQLVLPPDRNPVENLPFAMAEPRHLFAIPCPLYTPCRRHVHVQTGLDRYAL